LESKHRLSSSSLLSTSNPYRRFLNDHKTINNDFTESYGCNIANKKHRK
jgi:hypothetical protein